MSSTSCEKSVSAAVDACSPQVKNKHHLFALADCDNFFVSCERVFNPRLEGRPVVVLSSNDGCIISRSGEAKALGIKMGTPLHQATDIIKKARVQVLSSNYVLYGDMSRRVIATLRRFTPRMEVYSIDEAFLGLEGVTHGDITAYIRNIRSAVHRWTGIPVSIGVAETKTLAKIAARHAKQSPGTGNVFDMTSCSDREKNRILAGTPVEDVWGIGRRYSKWLVARRVTSAIELRDINDERIRKKAGIVGLRTVWELRGISSLSLELVVAPRKGITCSRSFGKQVREIGELSEAVATYASRAGGELRRDGSVAGTLTVFLMTNRFSSSPQYSKSAVLSLTPATDCDSDLIKAAVRGLKQIYRSGYTFHKTGVILTDLTPARELQTDLFACRNYDRCQRLNRAVDRVNVAFGAGTIRYAATGIRKRWKVRSDFRSPCYTTCWDEVPRVLAIRKS